MENNVKNNNNNIDNKTDNKTVWQRLSYTFGPNSLLNQDVPTYKFADFQKEILGVRIPLNQHEVHHKEHNLC